MRAHTLTRLLSIVWLPFLLFAHSANATVYSDALSGTDGWYVYDNQPSGAEVASVFDTRLQSRVIETRGTGRRNSYRLGGRSETDGWSNESEFVISWQMSTSQSFLVMVYLDTTAGPRRLYYSKGEFNRAKSPRSNAMGFGIGSDVDDGTWRTHERDLREDLDTGEPGNKLIAVHGVTVWGSLRLDNLTLTGGADQNDVPEVANKNTEKSFTMYADAENGVADWVVADKTPAGATVTAVFDSSHNSMVIQTNGDERSNTYLIGGTDATSGWNNQNEFSLSWDMATDEPYILMIYLDTDRGVRRMVYSKSNSDGLKNPGNNSIWFGLGSDAIGAGWRSYNRDLAADVALGEPGNTLRAVNGIAIAGSFRLDNIRLGFDGSDIPDTVFPPTATINAQTLAGTAPFSAMFSAASSTAVSPATITSYEWQLGNGVTASSSGATTTYTNPGSYTVSLRVTDSNGLSSTTTVSINVLAAVEPPVVEPPVVEPPVVEPPVIEPPVVVPVIPPVRPPEAGSPSAAAARLLAQATFGATLKDIAEVERLGIAGWVDNQFTLQGSSHLDYVQAHPGSGSLSGPRQHKWLIDAIDGTDQLRQRVAFAYSEIFVVSDVSQTLGYAQYEMANYYDMLLDNAFGNYRDLLEDVTLSPIMGIYLSMLQNGRGDPATNTRADENFAREAMQLFSIGLYELNLDGSIRRDNNGTPIPAYTQQNVQEYARVYTGWSYSDADRFDNIPTGPNTNQFLPMEPYPGYHDDGQKNLLRGVVSPAGITPQQDLAIALDSLFNHPNVGPFIGKQLIQRLVTSNPTPAYIARVASVFNNNGSGIRGDMRAVIRAILLDPEARGGYIDIADYGKLREPLLRWTHMWRAFDVQRGRQSTVNKYNHRSPYISDGGAFLGQSVLSASSVFNFFHPDFAPLGDIRDANLVAPEAEIYTDAYILSTTAKLSSLSQNQYQDGGDNALNTSYLDIRPQTALASDTEALLDQLDLLLMSGQMSAGMRAALLDHMNGLPSDEEGRSQRVRDGITLIMASPEYLVQK